MNGCFIVIEGPDGSGTTTQATLLAQAVDRLGHECVLTREPTDGPYGKRIREALAGKRTLSPMELQQTFCADRAEHLGSVILPALRKKKVVVCDRYVPSTLVYGEASGVSRTLLEHWNEGFVSPDKIVVLLPPFTVLCTRVQERNMQDVFEKEEFMRTVYEGYKRYGESHPEVCVLDSSKGESETLAEIFATVDPCLKH